MAKNYTIDPDYTDTPEEQFDLPDDVYHAGMAIAAAGKRAGVYQLEQYVAEYPDVLLLKQWLGMLLQKLGDHKALGPLLEKNYVDNPNSVMCLVQLAMFYTYDGQRNRTIEIMGTELDISARFPHRTVFRPIEVYSYYSCAVPILLANGRNYEAKKCYLDMQEADDDAKKVPWAKKLADGTDIRKDQFAAFKELKEYHYPEVGMLIFDGFDIDPAVLRKFIERPRKKVLHDLRLLLQRTMKNYAVAQKTIAEGDKASYQRMMDAGKRDTSVVHTMYLLGDLQAEECLDLALEVLSQDKGYLELFVGVMMADTFYDPIYKMGHKQLPTLLAFAKDAKVYPYCRMEVCQAAQQVAFYQPERKPEVVVWFKELLNHYIANSPTGNDNNDSGQQMLVTAVIELSAQLAEPELLPAIKALHDIAQPDPKLCPTYTYLAIKTDMAMPDYAKRELLGIIDRYEQILNQWETDENYTYTGNNELWVQQGSDSQGSGYRQSHQRLNPFTNKSSRVVPQSEPIQADRVGRNDPCPCGSGKKYKKCCG